MKDQILELITYKNLDLSECSDSWELYEELDHDGSLHEIIDGNIDIYNYDLRKWAVDNYNHVEDAMEEGLCEGVTDFHKLIQAGQYVALREEANEVVEQIFNETQKKAV